MNYNFNNNNFKLFFYFFMFFNYFLVNFKYCLFENFKKYLDNRKIVRKKEKIVKFEIVKSGFRILSVIGEKRNNVRENEEDEEIIEIDNIGKKKKEASSVLKCDRQFGFVLGRDIYCEINKMIEDQGDDTDEENTTKKQVENLLEKEDIKKEKNLEIARVSSFDLSDFIDEYAEKRFDIRQKIAKKHVINTFCRIICWNVQTVNKEYSKRQNKLEFARDVINENKSDFVFFIDINDKNNTVILNGYNKYSDGRSCLFIKHNIFCELTISRNCFVYEKGKLAFVYLTPNSSDVTLINNIIWLCQNNYMIVGDVNLKTNKNIWSYVSKFIGEDSLQTGFIGKNVVKKFASLAAPSDHCLIMGAVKLLIECDFPMNLVSVSALASYNNIKDLCKGIVPKFKIKIKPIQTHVNLNDREIVINKMLNEYLENNVKRIYLKYKYVYFTGKKEPFLGINVNDNVRRTFEVHLKADKGKVYRNIPSVSNSSFFDRNISIVKTKSKAKTFDFLSLADIAEGIRIFLTEGYSKVEDKQRVYYNISEVINNILRVANKLKYASIANTFFLLKNRKLEDYNDVRMIIIMPFFIKAFEVIVYNAVSDYFLEYFGRNPEERYQFGGIKGGSTYMAMLKLRDNYETQNADTVALIDLEKGYDTVNMVMLKQCIKEKVRHPEVKQLLMSWWALVYNVDYVINNQRVRRTRGLAMGLSLSPVMFEFYLDIALADIDKNSITCYVDDIALVINSRNLKPIEVKDRIESLDKELKKFDLIINRKKTVIMSKDSEVNKIMAKDFKVEHEEKYLGRLIRINGDGRLLAEDRYYNRGAFRAITCPYWVNFFVKRLVFNNGVISKFAYGLYMFSTNDRAIRNAAFRNAWWFLKTNMIKFNYLQVVYSIINYFRFFIDGQDMRRWIKRKKEGENPDLINDEVKNKLMIDLPQLKPAVEMLIPRWDIGDTDLLEKTKSFNDYLYKQFKGNVLKIYLKKKKEEHKEVYANLEKFLESRLMKHFGILQNIVFRHISPKKRIKQIALYLVLKSINVDLCNALKVIDNLREEDDFDVFKFFNGNSCIERINVEIDTSEVKDMTDSFWESLMLEKYKEVWVVVDNLIFLAENAMTKTQIEDEKVNKHDRMFPAAFVDGSYNSKNNKVGYAAILVRGFDKIDKNLVGGKIIDSIVGWEYDNEEVTENLKNVYGELRATLLLIEYLVKHYYHGINLYFDYWGIQKYANMEWATQSRFITEYIHKIREARAGDAALIINFIKVTSHTGCYWNEVVDGMAKNQCGIPVKGKVNKKYNKWNNAQGRALKSLYRQIFKFLLVFETVFMNNNLNDLSIVELLFNVKMKLVNLDELTEKMYQAMVIDDSEEVNNEYNDLMLDCIKDSDNIMPLNQD